MSIIAVICYFNFSSSVDYFRQRLDNPSLVSLGTSLAAVDWVYEDSGQVPFNIDVYVPPVIPYAYDYLFLWRGKDKYEGRQPEEQIVESLYTVEEVDLENEVLLNAWLARQASFSSIDESHSFGGVTARRRVRHTLSP